MPENHSLMSDKKFVLKSPAPWRLEGEGILLIFRFKSDWVENKGNLPKHLIGKFRGGLGLVLLANYQDTPVGPFREVLFIPGKFRKTKKQAITTIFTDTEVSTQNGRANWGMPKETLPIEWETTQNRDQVNVVKNGKTVFSAAFESAGISFPFSTALFPLRLCQTWNKLKYFSRLSGSGWGKLAKITQLDLDPDYFPDIRGIAPLLAIKVNPFFMRFPESTYRDDFI